MRSARNLFAALAVLVVAPALPGAALAHVDMVPASAPAGMPMDFRLQVRHGCEGASTTALEVRIPAQAADARALATNGWKAGTSNGVMKWTGGPLPDHELEEFPFRATLYGDQGETVMFKAIQRCGSKSTAWIQPVTGGQEPELPAPSVELSSGANAPVSDQAEVDRVAEDDARITGEPTATDVPESSDESSDSDSGRSILLLVVVGLAVGTVIGLVLRSRRNP